MDRTWFMKKVIVTILNGKLMVGYFVFTVFKKKDESLSWNILFTLS